MARKHIHKLERRNIGRKKDYVVYACVLPGCQHYIAKELALGKQSICWKCGNITTLNARDITYKHPLCSNCKGTVRPDIAEFNKKKFGIVKDTTEIVNESNQDLLNLLGNFLEEEK